MLEEEVIRRGLEKESNGILDQSKDICSQFQKASKDHQVMAEQLAVYKSDLEKERAQQEKLLKVNKILKSEKDSMQQEMNSMAARLQQVST